MADIELVIKIPEEKYQGILNMTEEILDAGTFCSPRYLYKAVLYGTPLPKGHGDLVDIKTLIPDRDYDDGIFGAVSCQQIVDADVIIEADKEQKNNGFFDEIMDDELEDEETYEKIKEIIDKVKEQE